MHAKGLRVATQNVWRFHGDWPARRSVLREGLRDLRPDVVGFQEAIVTDDYDQPRDLLGPDFHLAHQRLREADGSCVSIGSRWPIVDVRELDGRTSARTRRHPFNCGTLAAEIEAPAPIGRLLYVNHIPSWQQGFELEREAQTVAAAQLVEQMLDGRPAHVVLAGDLDAEPESASIRFLRGLQSLHGVSVVYRDAWSDRHPGDRGHTFSPQNPMVPTGETGAYALERGRRIDYVFVGCSDHGPTLDIRDCDRLFDEPVDDVWASDHFGVTAELSTVMADGRPVP
jgi:endonuclease/exonuclease/phosphatase family metal-dependent hydrolase